MITHLTRRLMIGLVTLLLITFVVFGLIRSMPGSPLTLTLSEDPSRRVSQLDYELMKKAYGLDKPWPQAYCIWLGNLARLDLGYSLYEKEPVATVIGRRVGPTLLLSLPSMLLTYLLAVPIGLWATVRSGRADERILSTVLYGLYSLPTYVAALLLLVFFSLQMVGTPFELPLHGMTSDNYGQLSWLGKSWDILRHMLLPLVCFTYGGLAYYSRFVKANMEEVVRQDYIRTARAKGVPPRRIIVRHAFANTMIPFVTDIGLTLPAILGGSVILEMLFSWPGMGQLFFQSISRRDYPVIMGLTLMFSLLTLAGQLLADVLYSVVDPRVSFS